MDFTSSLEKQLNDPNTEATELVLAIRSAGLAERRDQIPRLLELRAHPHARVRAEALIALLARFQRADQVSPALEAVAEDKALFNHAADGALLAYALEHPRESPPILRALARIALERQNEGNVFVERIARDIDGLDKLLRPSSPPIHARPEDIPMSSVWTAVERIAAKK